MASHAGIEPTAVYVVAEVAELVRCDRRAVWAAMGNGELRYFVPNGCTRGKRMLGQWVIDWIESRAACAKD